MIKITHTDARQKKSSDAAPEICQGTTQVGAGLDLGIVGHPGLISILANLETANLALVRREVSILTIWPLTQD